MTLRLPRLSQGVAMVDGKGRPASTFQTYFNNMLLLIEEQAGDIAGQGATIANTTATATSASTTAETAQANAATVAASLALALSYADPIGVLTTDTDPADATKRRITIAAHTRRYLDGSSVAVAGGTIAGLLAATTYYVTYLDAGRVGGPVAYSVSTNVAVTVQSQGRHLVGSITTPA